MIKRWAQHGSGMQLETNYEGHIDWVNDLALLGDTLVSCSSDQTLKVWQAMGTGQCAATLKSHSDYVTCMATSSSAGLLASGGLRGEVMLWDMAILQQVLGSQQQHSHFAPTKADGMSESVYAVAMDTRGALLAAGSTESSIRMVDARTGARVMQLKGHSDNVRALALNSEGTLLLSGSSDHTIRLWDLGQQRCLHTFAVHTDSVWALQADDSFGVVYSGGRDKCVYRTHLTTRQTELMFVEEHPVRKLALTPGDDSVWVATLASSVKCWRADPLDPTVAPLSPLSPTARKAVAVQGASPQRLEGSPGFLAPASTLHRGRMVFDGGVPHPPPKQQQPLTILKGMPALKHAVILTDRRHVLSQDEEGTVQLWDLTAGAVVRDFGRCSLKDLERELFQPTHSVSPWCTLDCKLGDLSGHMETPQCFQAEIYAQDLGYADAPVDQKVNFGEHMLRALLGPWAERRAERQLPHAAVSGSMDGGGSAWQEGAASLGPEAEGGEGGEDMGREDSLTGPARSDDAAAAGSPPPRPAFQLASRVAPIITVSGGDRIAWRRSMQDFDGSEPEGSFIPQWVADCVLRSEYPLGKELKIAFQVLPLEGSGLPSMLQSKLNAPRVLRINKVADYIVKKMADQGLTLREEPLFWDASKQQEWEVQQEQPQAAAASSVGGASPTGSDKNSRFSIKQIYSGVRSAGGGQHGDLPLLITCHGMVVPWDFSLAAVKQWMWKRSDDLILHYSIRDASIPLKLPNIRPPS